MTDQSVIGETDGVAVIGAGSIGSAWATVFATAGLRVRLHDTAPERLEAALGVVADRLDKLYARSLLAEPPRSIIGRIVTTRHLSDALNCAPYIQECVPESLELKQALFVELDRLAQPEAILASSSSFLPISRVASDLAGRHRALIAHPGNPPYLLRVVEVVPASFTAADVVERTCLLMARCGLAPVRLRKEIEGFVFNRLQGALLREAYCLVRDGIASAGDIDLLVREGLGLRWSLTGPFETVDLNTRGGIAAHAERMGPAYLRMGRERGQNDPWTEELVASVEAERRRQLPLEDWEARVQWRDEMLMALIAWRRQAGIGRPGGADQSDVE
jgi:3-hydroxyacyl-CoA dehydrogenase